MNIAVLTLTRDRLSYTQRCFQTLRDNAGCEFDWYVLDQGSGDGTQQWLLEQDDLNVTSLGRNIGICRGLNLLLAEAVNPADYDVIVRYDNDCEVTQPGTLATVCEAALSNDMILAPRVLGLRQPPPTLYTIEIDDQTVSATAVLGGIFMAIPAHLFAHYRYDERNALWTGDEAICAWYLARGGVCGYLESVTVNHYLTTDGQQADDPAYWDRKLREMVA